jgi:putative selenium metabolism protein SsnA
MGTILFKNATAVSLDPLALEACDLRIAGGLIKERGTNLPSEPGDELIDLGGKLVLPGLVCAHTHLYSSLARGMPAPKQSPQNFHEILKYVWWRLDRALDEETIYWSAIAGGIDAIRSGTTTLIDHHASPGSIQNSLGILKQALSELGLRSVVCYEVTDRGGEKERDLGLAENRNALESSTGLFRALVGAHAAFTLNPKSLRLLAELAESFNCGVHIHVAEDRLDEEEARRNYQMSLVERLEKAGLLRPGSILAHCTHLAPESLKAAQEAGCWLIHNPRSNMNNSVGYAGVSQFGSTAALGTDGIGADMFEEAKFAFYKSRDAQRPLMAEDVLKLLAGGQRLASSIFKEPLGKLTADAPADLTVLDYYSPTPLASDNFAWHFIFGISGAQVKSVMVGGKFLLRDGNLMTIDAEQAAEKARQAAKKLWTKMEKII